ncbi:MAG: winged helix-turn-helix domain-containing protein [Chitinophagaceae bacterium]
MEAQFKQIASLIGDPTRAVIMWTLMDGKAFTATELAIAANTSAPNISMHLAKLVQAELLSVESQGRHRYYKFSREEIAYAIEAMTNLLPAANSRRKADSEDIPAIKQCRTCYDHLAGKLGVAVTDSMLKQRIIIERSNNFTLSSKGKQWFSGFGIDAELLQQQRRSFLRPCLDWSERRYHIAGSLAAALLDKILFEDWIRKSKNSRAVVITAKGQKSLYKYLQIIV